MKRNYPRLGVISFGRKLLETGDLDPVYIMLHKAKLPPNQLNRWLLAYWWFYHCGVASYIAQVDPLGFYERALRLAQTKGTPRGTERRHFRGKACVSSISFFREKYSRPENAVENLTRVGTEDGTVGVRDIVGFVEAKWPLFGPWIGFKIADMLERLEICPVHFTYKTLELYSEPTKGAEIVCQKKGWKWYQLGVSGTVKRLEERFQEYKAPPRYERKVGIQEVETILCKWKSHLNGHYPVGKDTKEIREGLEGWGKLAEKLRENLP